MNFDVSPYQVRTHNKKNNEQVLSKYTDNLSTEILSH